MFRFIGDQTAYGFFGNLSVIFSLVLSLFFYFSKRNSISAFSKLAIFHTSRLNDILGKIVKVVLVSAESLLVARLCTVSTMLNRTFGDLVGTGANYFALLIIAPIFIILLSLLIVSNPLKELDFASVILPFMLVFVKLSCFGNGCCWGIEWEHGMYNSHPDHPGYQVPVQAIEALWALLIFFFFLWYRKRARVGTMYPMYLILFSGTRFFSEFLRHEENVLGPFKTYHLLCMAGFVIGLILFFIMRKYGEKISAYFEKPHIKLEEKLLRYSEEKELALAEGKERAAADEADRLEKVRLAREKAKARKK